MKIIIAEKPSVAKSIAAVVGANNKKEGYMEGGGHAVTWAFGHLVGLAMPEHYGIARFQRRKSADTSCRVQTFTTSGKRGQGI